MDSSKIITKNEETVKSIKGEMQYLSIKSLLITSGLITYVIHLFTKDYFTYIWTGIAFILSVPLAIDVLAKQIKSKQYVADAYKEEIDTATKEAEKIKKLLN